jgi:hypothetical protein
MIGCIFIHFFRPHWRTDDQDPFNNRLDGVFTHDSGLWRRRRRWERGGGVFLGGSATGGERNPVCTAGQAAATAVSSSPYSSDNLYGQTSWFASPVVADLDGDGENELIAAYYSLYALSPGRRSDRPGGRQRQPHLRTPRGGGPGGRRRGRDRLRPGAACLRLRMDRPTNLRFETGWPQDTTCAGSSPEVRGLAAADLDGNGQIEIVATTTQTLATDDGGAQVFVWPRRLLYQPAGGSAYARLAALQQPQRRRRRRRPQRHGAQRLRLLRPERRHGRHRRR